MENKPLPEPPQNIKQIPAELQIPAEVHLNFTEDNCCICLDNINEMTETVCCKIKMHLWCLVSWYVHKGAFSCPLCRSENRDQIDLKTLLEFQMMFRDDDNFYHLIDLLNGNTTIYTVRGRMSRRNMVYLFFLLRIVHADFN